MPHRHWWLITSPVHGIDVRSRGLPSRFVHSRACLILKHHMHLKKMDYIHILWEVINSLLPGYVVVILTHWGRVTHICVGDLTIIGSHNGLSPSRRQAIIGTNAGVLLIRPLGTNLSEILIKIITFSFKKMRSKVSSGKRGPSCLGLDVLKVSSLNICYELCILWNCCHVNITKRLWH